MTETIELKENEYLAVRAPLSIDKAMGHLDRLIKCIQREQKRPRAYVAQRGEWFIVGDHPTSKSDGKDNSEGKDD